MLLITYECLDDIKLCQDDMLYVDVQVMEETTNDKGQSDSTYDIQTI